MLPNQFWIIMEKLGNQIMQSFFCFAGSGRREFETGGII